MTLTSIIILNWNGMDFTRPCIESVHKNTKKAFEIILVDNGSKKEEIEELKAMKKSGLIHNLILNNENKGFSGANNQALREAKGDYIVLLNNDTLVPENWLRDIVVIADSDENNGIVGVNLPADENDRNVYADAVVTISGQVSFTVKPMKSGMTEYEVDQVGGAALLFKRSVFEKIGELDEGFNPIYFEETDYCARARKVGFKVIFAPQISIIHFGSKITEKQPGRWMYIVMKKNRVRYMLLHFPWWKLLLAVPFELARVIKSLFELKTHWLFAAYWINLKSFGEILKKRIRYRKGNVKIDN